MNGHANHSKTFYVFIAIACLALVTGLTIGALMLIAPRKVTNDSHSSLRAASPASLVASLKSHPDNAQLKGFSPESTSGAPQGSVEYMSSSKNYAVIVDTADVVTLIGKAPFAFKDVSRAVGTWLKSYGFVAAPHPASEPTAVYTNANMVCRLNGSGTSATTAYVFACVSQSSITAAYATQEPLLALYKKAATNGVTPYASVHGVYAKKGTLQSAILTLTATDPQQPPRSLLFGAVNGSWEYITDLSSDVTPKGTYALSAAQAETLQNAKYGTFLIDQLRS